MKTIDLDYLAFKRIFGMGLPVYMLGASSQVSKRLLSMINKDGYKLEAVWDERWQQIRNSEEYKELLNKYQIAGYEICPVPADIDAVPKGIIIVAAEERYQRKWMHYCEKSPHYVYDGYDVLYYKTYCRCIEENQNEDVFLEKCRNCQASFRSCPVRRNYYEKQRGEVRTKVIRHIAMKVGYVCNLKCNYCCEYVPRFTTDQRKTFDLQGCMADIEKLCGSMEYIDRLSFSGGDAMLNKELSVLIDEVAKKDNIGDIYILTNGTYLPHKDILDALERNKERIRIVINNYSINHNAEKMVPELEKRKINYNVRDNAGWYDLTDISFRNYSIYHLKDLYENCSFDKVDGFYYIMFEGKISMRCGVANGLLYFMNKYEECTEDYVDIREISTEKIADALTCLENRDYLDICSYCVGCKASERTIGAAMEQL